MVVIRQTKQPPECHDKTQIVDRDKSVFWGSQVRPTRWCHHRQMRNQESSLKTKWPSRSHGQTQNMHNFNRNWDKSMSLMFTIEFLGTVDIVALSKNRQTEMGIGSTHIV